MVKANGTVAKDIGLYFLRETFVERYTPSIVNRTVGQAKSLLEAGYTEEEIYYAIDHLTARGVDMYSLGYVSTAINDVLRERQAWEDKAKAEEIQRKMIELHSKDREEIEVDDESAKRNREKAERFNLQSRKRTKFDKHMFEE